MALTITGFQKLVAWLERLLNSKAGYPIDATYRLLYTHFLSRHTRVVDVDGRKMEVDLLDVVQNMVSTLGEPFEEEVISREVSRGDSVMDLGANIGFYTLIMAEIVGEEGEVFAFEPDPPNFEKLEASVELNGFDNVRLEQKAAFHRTGKHELYISEEDRSTHRLYPSEDRRKCITIDTVKIDEYLTDEEFDFIKIDVEGAEYKALEGMRKTINRSGPLKMVVELSPPDLAGFDVTPGEYMDLLRGFGFELYVIDEADRELKSVPDNRLNGRLNPLGYMNLLCVRG